MGRNNLLAINTLFMGPKAVLVRKAVFEFDVGFFGNEFI